ncbi:MAG: fasciclin domain-containing protein [Pricia sp.]
MRTLSMWKSISLFAILIFGLSACSDDDDGNVIVDNDENIVEIAQGSPSLSVLVDALATADENEGTDLIGTLSGDGPFTVFAPTNDAFTELLGSLDDYDSLEDFESEEERALLAEILRYHVINGTGALASTLSDGQTITTLQGEDITISLDGGVFVQDASDDNAQVLEPDVIARNGVVHIIDKVLLPQAALDAINAETPPAATQTLTEIVVATENLSLLEEAVVKAELAATLSSEGPFTVFAPTDDAFLALLETLGDDYESLDDFDEDEEINLLRNILLYHVVPDSVPASALAAGSVATAFPENSIEVIASGDTFVIGDASEVDANITATDIAATNGIAHTIDKVLLPQEALDFVASLEDGDEEEDGVDGDSNIVETAQGTEGLGILVEALVQADADLVETLEGDGPFTVFAPTDEAFQELLDLLGPNYTSIEDFDTEDEMEILATVLSYHVVSGTAALSTSLSDDQMIETAQGESVTIVLADGSVQIDDATDINATVTTPDVETSNGVVHVIDKVLLPEEILTLLNL